MSEPTSEPIANTDMAAAWDGDEGSYWAAHYDRFDASNAAYAPHLQAAAAVQPTDSVLDIGCGCGASTRAAARRASAGRAVGADLSAEMLARARDLAAAEGVSNVEFVQADAQVHDFGTAAFDVVISRFGGMFFADPVAAFRNIGRAHRPGGRLAMLAWQSLDRNEWGLTVLTALAAGREVPTPPARAPGPFGLADPEHVRRVLAAAGYDDVALTEVAEPLRFGADADDAFGFIRGMGVATSMLADLDDVARKAALDELHGRLAERATADGVVFPSSAWVITAQRPA